MITSTFAPTYFEINVARRLPERQRKCPLCHSLILFLSLTLLLLLDGVALIEYDSIISLVNIIWHWVGTCVSLHHSSIEPFKRFLIMICGPFLYASNCFRRWWPVTNRTISNLIHLVETCASIPTHTNFEIFESVSCRSKLIGNH